jgi:hypothetical protein
MPTISIAEVLADSHKTYTDGKSSTFAISYYKDDGSIGSVARAQRNVKQGSSGQGTATNLRKNDLLLIYDHDANKHKYITIALIRTFNNTRVFH